MTRAVLLAFRFLTVFPLGKGAQADPPTLRGSLSWFPLVGAVLGALLALADFVFMLFLPAAVSSALVLAFLVVMTGALHLDGFADTVDGIAGGATPEDRLRIMRDSSTGAIGVVFLVLLLLLKFLSIMSLPENIRWHSLFLMPVAGRWAMTVLARLAPYARKEGGLGMHFASGATSTLLHSTAIAALAAYLALGSGALLLLALIAPLAVISARFFMRRIGGVTGDVFGFQCEATELFFLLAVLFFDKASSGLI